MLYLEVKCLLDRLFRYSISSNLCDHLLNLIVFRLNLIFWINSENPIKSSYTNAVLRRFNKQIVVGLHHTIIKSN